MSSLINYDMLLGNEIKKFLIDNNIKQKDIAQKLGWWPDDVSKILKGKKRITTDKLIDLCDILNIEVTFKTNKIEIIYKNN